MAAPTATALSPADLLTEAASAGSSRVVVRLDGPLTSESRAALARGGVFVHESLGDNFYFAETRPVPDQWAHLAAAGRVVSAEHIRPEWKIHPLLQAPDPPAWAVVRRVDSAGVEAEAPTIVAYVWIHRSATIAQAEQAVLRAGGVVLRRLASVNGLVVELPAAAIPRFAGESSVMFVEPALPPLEATNYENRALTGAEVVQALPYGLSGSGVTVMVYDAGSVRDTHVDFGGRVMRMDPNEFGFHATHVAGTIGGDGTASMGFDRGMAPAVQILSYSFDFLAPRGILFVTDPLDLENNIRSALEHGADIMNASLALNLASNTALDCSIEGDYTMVSGLIDGIVRGSLGRPLPSVWGGGNERGNGRCGTTFGTVPPPHAAKNHMVLGAVNADEDSIASFSSWGPVDDGRIKPDFVAPGCQVDGDAGVTSVSGFDDTGYLTICGTSMAAPTATGLCSLIIEDYRAQYPGRPALRNASFKALLAHTAVDRGNPGPDYQHGYGSVRVQPAIELLRSGAFREDSLTQNGSYVRTVIFAGGDPELRTTLVWDDYPATPNVVPSLVNDLELVVTSPSGVRHYPWTLNPAIPWMAAVRTQPDHLNNIEQVLVHDPEPGAWTIQVLGYQVPEGPQPYTLVGDGADQNGVAFDYPAGLPALTTPAAPQPIQVQILAVDENIVPGSARLHYRLGPGAFQSVPLSSMGGHLYAGQLPGAECNQVVEYYVSVAGSSSGEVRSPYDAPASYFIAEPGTDAKALQDDFETDQGWTASSAGATAGFWQRGTPAPRGPLGLGPQQDADGSGKCYVTANTSGLDDVDNGSVVLTSPPLDLSGPSSSISFAYYLYTNDQTSGNDRITAEVSANGSAGPRAEVFRWHYATGSSGQTIWHWATITSDMMRAAGVTPSATTRIRFLATDAGTASTVEAAIDTVSVVASVCPVTPCDYAQANIKVFLDYLLNEVPAASPECWSDANGDGQVDGGDIQGFVDRMLSP